LSRYDRAVWTPERVAEHLARFKAKDRATVSVADAELPRQSVVEAQDQAQDVHPRFRVCINYRSRRLADPTGRSHKAAVDGIVSSGVLGDDSSEWVEFASPTEAKCKKGEEEQTVIELFEITADADD